MANEILQCIMNAQDKRTVAKESIEKKPYVEYRPLTPIDRSLIETRKSAEKDIVQHISLGASELLSKNFNTALKELKEFNKILNLKISDKELAAQLKAFRNTKIHNTKSLHLFKNINTNGIATILLFQSLFNHIKTINELPAKPSNEQLRGYFKEIGEMGFEVATAIGFAFSGPLVIADIFLRLVFGKSFIQTGMAIGEVGGKISDNIVEGFVTGRNDEALNKWLDKHLGPLVKDKVSDIKKFVKDINPNNFNPKDFFGKK